MGIELTSLHWVYVIFILSIIGFMVMRRDTTAVCIIGILVLGYMAKGSIVQAVGGLFESLVFAINELMGTILIISIIVAMSKILLRVGINEIMVTPVAGLIRTPIQAYWIIGIFMMVISWFFWPSPACALTGAILLPVATRVGLPAVGVAMAMNLFGHGIALSGDFVIQGAPKLTADAAGIPVQSVVSASVPLVFIMGAVTTLTAFWLLFKEMRAGKLQVNTQHEINYEQSENSFKDALSLQVKQILAGLVAALFLLDIWAMYYFKLQGGDATALIGGTAIGILVVITMLVYQDKGYEEITNYLVEGFHFGFKIFGPVIPIAAFFYLGDAAFIKIYGKVLPTASQGLVNDLGAALAAVVPMNAFVGTATLTTVGAITGLDGSGFSGISLVGSIARMFSTAIGSGVATLTALGQIAAIWVGGGTVVPWGLIAAAAICGVDPFELARRNLVPVTVGLVVTTIAAAFLL